MKVRKRTKSTSMQRVCGPLIALALFGCDWPGKPNPADRPVPPDQVLEFDALYSRNCAGCHGADGRFGPAPPLNDPLFVALIPKDTLADVIRSGRPGTPMPRFAQSNGGSLTDEQIAVIVHGIRSHWASDEKQSAELPHYELSETSASKLSPGAPERGAQVFARACAGCHGENGRGIEQDGILVHRINAPAFLPLISDQAIRRIIITGRVDLHMPNYAESDGREDDFQPLNSTDIDDLGSLIAEWRATSNMNAHTAQSP